MKNSQGFFSAKNAKEGSMALFKGFGDVQRNRASMPMAVFIDERLRRVLACATAKASPALLNAIGVSAVSPVFVVGIAGIQPAESARGVVR